MAHSRNTHLVYTTMPVYLPIWTCPWAKIWVNLVLAGSRLCGTHISETTEQI